MASEGQKHHYIPVFYLKQWTSGNGKLCEYSRPHGVVKGRMKHPGGAGFERGLYSINGVSDDVKDIVETKYLSLADGQAAVALQNMVHQKIVPVGNDKAAWIRFILSLFYRTPEGVARTFQAIKERYLTHDLEAARKVYAEHRREGDPEKLEDYLELEAPKAVGFANANSLLSLISSPKVGGAIMRMHWYIVEMSGLKHTLLTSDRPIVMTNGLGKDDSHLVLPVSPTHMFVAAASDAEIKKLKELSQNGDIAKRLNDHVARQARKFVYGVDDRQLRFVENRLGEKAVWSPFE